MVRGKNGTSTNKDRRILYCMVVVGRRYSLQKVLSRKSMRVLASARFEVEFLPDLYTGKRRNGVCQSYCRS